MASIYRLGSRLWARLKDERGAWTSEATPFVVGQEKPAAEYIRKLQRGLDETRASGTAARDLTVRTYSAGWLIERAERGLASVDDDRGRITNHVLPHLGDRLLAQVRPVDIRDLVRALKKTELAPRTIRNVYAVLKTMFADALVEEKIVANPCVLKRGELPAKVDKHAEWRHLATCRLDEVQALIGDARLPMARRVQYALKALAGLRHGEAAGLRWRHYDAAATPLGKITLVTSYDRGETKTKVTRPVPVHPTLAVILAIWRVEWEHVFGRAATDADLVIPYQRADAPPMIAQRAGELFVEDLGTLGLRTRAGEHRNRGGHDLRAWFITTAQEHGAHRDLLRVVTHTRKGDILDGYTRASWSALCAEVAKLRIELPSARAAHLLQSLLRAPQLPKIRLETWGE